MAEEACNTDFLGVNLNGFIGETIKEVAKKEDCEAELKKIRFNSIEGQRKNDYCSCIENSKLSLYARNLGTIKADPSYIESKKKAEKELAKNYAKALRGKIFGIVSRSFKLDNLAKRGFLTNNIARDKENKCQIDKVLEGMESFKSYEDKFSSCEGKSAVFNERKQMLFPEGYEVFLNNLKDVSNSVAKGVRTEGSCLTYQNYLELNSTIPTNSEGVKILGTASSWEDFKAKIAKEMDTFDRYKKRLNAVRNTSNNLEVAEKISGFSGIENRGRDIYRLVKSNPSFELALRDKKYFEKMQAQFNMFENNASNGGFVGGEPRASADDFFKDKANDLMKPHLEACYSESKKTNSGEMGGGGTSTLGLNQTIAKFLCDENLPSTRPETIEDSLSSSLKGLNSSELIGKVLSSDLVCTNKKSFKAELLSDIDPLLSVDSDLDINSENYLKDYKDFSASFCKLISPDCSDPQKAKKNPKCEKLSTMAQTALANSLSRYANEFLVPAKEGDFPKLAMMNIIMSSPQISSEDAFQNLKSYLDENYPNKISSKDLAILKEQIITLRPHIESVSIYKDIFKLDPIPNKGMQLSRFFRTKEGIDFLKNHNSVTSKRILGTLADDTNVNLKNDITVSNFTDVFINGHTSNTDGSPAFANKGPALDNQYYNITTPASTTTHPDNDTPKKTNSNYNDDDGFIRRAWKSRKGDGGKGLKDNWQAIKDAVKDNPKDRPRDVVISKPKEVPENVGGIRSLDDLLPVASGNKGTTPPKADLPQVDPKPETPTEVVAKEEPKETPKDDNKGVPLLTNSKAPVDGFQSLSLTSSSSSSNNSDSRSTFNNGSLNSNISESEADRLKKQALLSEIAKIKEQLKEGITGAETNSNTDMQGEAEKDELKARISKLQNDIDREALRSANSSALGRLKRNNFNDSTNNGGLISETDPNFWNKIKNKRNNFNPRDPFKRQDTKREITSDHMNELDPAGNPVVGKGGGSGKGKDGGSKGGGVALTAESYSESGFMAELGLRPIMKRGTASSDTELDPEVLCGFEEQELNCIFEHSEIFARYKKDQIKSLVEGLLLHGYSFKTIEMYRNKDPNMPNEYIIHYFEPAKNLSSVQKKEQFELIKKMMTDYKRNYSFLKTIASKVVKTKSVKIGKKEAFLILKHTLKRPDIDVLLIRRIKTILRLPANVKN